MSVTGDVSLEVHLVVLGVHHGERVVLILVVTEPRAVRKLREQHHAARTILGAPVAVFLLYQGTVRTKNVREVLVVLALGKLLDFNLRPCPPHGCLLIWCERPRGSALVTGTFTARCRWHNMDIGLRVLSL